MCCYFAYSTEYYRDFVGCLKKFREGQCIWQENQSIQDLFHSKHQFWTNSSHLDKVCLTWKRYPKILNWTPITVKLFKSSCWSRILLDNFLLTTFLSSKSQLSNFPLASFNVHPFHTKWQFSEKPPIQMYYTCFSCPTSFKKQTEKPRSLEIVSQFRSVSHFNFSGWY